MPLSFCLKFLERKMKEWAERNYHAGKGNKKSTVTVLKKQTCGFPFFELNLSFQAEN